MNGQARQTQSFRKGLHGTQGGNLSGLKQDGVCHGVSVCACGVRCCSLPPEVAGEARRRSGEGGRPRSAEATLSSRACIVFVICLSAYLYCRFIIWFLKITEYKQQGEKGEAKSLQSNYSRIQFTVMQTEKNSKASHLRIFFFPFLNDQFMKDVEQWTVCVIV